MPLHLYNSLTKKVEPVAPADPARVTFYTCGPTVYDFAHIGNFRSFLVADVLRRWLESPLCELTGEGGTPHKGSRTVTHVMNITDVGHMTDDDSADGGGVDRMEEGGRRLLEAKKSGKLPPGAPEQIDPRNPAQIAAYYAAAFLEDAKLLGLKVASEADDDPTLMPRPTQRIPQMLAMIQTLIDKGDAYLVGQAGQPGAAVYFDVQKFPDYGALSGNTLDRLRAGAGGRVSEATQAGKRHPADFLLWKCDPSHVMKWDSPWGPGYPGWHIECSAMARQRLGDVIDLHSGGEDNIFPHHECEIAQSRCATGKPAFARHWLHVRHLMVEGEKMSKSKGNFYTIRDLLERGGDEITPAAIRLELIKTHYRANANFTIQGLKDSARQLRRWRELRTASASSPSTEPAGSAPSEFARAMHDDLNIAGAIAALNAWPVAANGAPKDSARFLQALDALGLNDEDTRPASTSDDAAEIESLIAARAAAKKAKNFAESDRIRDQLTAMGIEIKDTPQGTTWSRKASL